MVRTNRPAFPGKPRIVGTIREGGPARVSRGSGHLADWLLALRLLNRSLGQHAGQVLLVLRAGPQIAARVEPVRGMLRGLFRLGATLQSLLDRGRPNRRDADVGEADAPSAV